jgi:hypothetical protein
MMVHFGTANDVLHNTHFDIIGPAMPEGTQVYVLAPVQQNYVMSQGIIVKGVAYRTVEDLEADIREGAANLHDFLEAHIDKSRLNKTQRDALQSYAELIKGRVVELFRDNWALYQIKLP